MTEKSLYEKKQKLKEVNTLQIFSDGGSRGNPGKSACAFVVIKNQDVVFENAISLGINTNNFAEYSAIVAALSYVEDNQKELLAGIKKIEYFLDSELAARQLAGMYKVKSKNIISLFLKVKEIQKNIPVRIFFIHVRRDKNTRADYLLNKRLDENN